MDSALDIPRCVRLDRYDIFVLGSRRVDFFAVFAPGVPRDMVRGRINQIFVHWSLGPRVPVWDAYLEYAHFRRCAMNTPTHG